MMASMSELVGMSGRRYLFREIIHQRPGFGGVWLATSGGANFVLKVMPKELFDHFNNSIRPKLREHPNIRLPSDTIQDHSILAYRYMTDDVLSLVKKQLLLQARKQILKASLQGIAEMHAADIVHLDIKPDNILVDYTGTSVEKVQIIDLENTCNIPRGSCLKGMLTGNENWRSPEAHFGGELNRPTDIFSFGAVCIYAVLGRILFGVDDDFRLYESKGAQPLAIRMQRQISYFGTQDGLNGLKKILGDEEISTTLGELWDDRAADYHPYRPFSEWPDVDAEFKDLIQKMMNLDPLERITAREALKHPWFASLEDNQKL